MIPYFEWRVIELGPITLQVWGLFVALGFLLGTLMASWLAKERRQDVSVVFDLVPWLVFAGIVGGRVGHVLFYAPKYYFSHPLEILYVWEGGASFFGGLIACLAVGIWFMRKRQVDVWQYSDILVFGLPFGYALGRVGCFLIHDHPGTATDFVLGVRYEDGIVRHDLGLYLAIDTFLLSLFFLWLSRKPRPVGLYVVVFSLWYGISRFFLDFLRVADVRYFGLTPAQYLCIFLVTFGLVLGYRIWNRGKEGAVSH